MNKQQGSAHVVIVVILVVALLSALGFIFWQNFVKQDDPKPESKSSQPVNDEPVEGKPATKTYTAKAYTFDYPEDWVLEEMRWNSADPTDITPEVRTSNYEPNVGMGLKSGAYVSVAENPTTSSPEEEKANLRQFNATEIKDVTVDGAPAISYRLDYEGIRYKTLIYNGSTTYIVTYQYGTTNPETYMQAYETAVRSFKFR